MGERLEVLALERAAAHLAAVDGYVTMNVSPGTFLTEPCLELLDRLPLERVVLELSEHEAVEDYDLLRSTLAPFRARGLRLAIDDVGAGFSSLRHIVLTAPDVLKLDRSLITGLGDDPVLRTLVRSLVTSGTAAARRSWPRASRPRAMRCCAGSGWTSGRAGTTADPDRRRRSTRRRDPRAATPRRAG